MKLAAALLAVVLTAAAVPASARAQQIGARLLDLDELLAQADFITIHMPKTPETIGMISDDQFAIMKDTAYVVNVARGGLIDEDALNRALEAGTVGGAAIDVFSSEPAIDLPFFNHDNAVVTPHLGASTSEAQEKAGVSVAKSVRLALADVKAGRPVAVSSSRPYGCAVKYTG